MREGVTYVTSSAHRLSSSHDDVIEWKHFPRYWPFVRGIHRSPVNSPHKGQWRGALTFSLICVWINGWVNNCEADDLRYNRAHYDVIVMHRQKMGFGSRQSQGDALPTVTVGWLPRPEIFMMTSSNGNIFRVTGPLCGEFTGPGEFPTQRPVTRSFDVFFDLRLNNRLSKHSWAWWFETLSCSLWRHRNVYIYRSRQNKPPFPSYVKWRELYAGMRDHDNMGRRYDHCSHITWPPSRLGTPSTLLFIQELFTVNIKALYCLFLMMETNRWPVDSPHKGSVMRKAFPCHVTSQSKAIFPSY